MLPGDTIKAHLLDEFDLDRMLNRMARQILELLEPGEELTDKLGIIGMQLRGVFVARRLVEKIKAIEGVDIAMGILDANMYRDDYRMTDRRPEIRETNIPFDISDMHIVLVDDVMFTGRTTRAALDALMDIGRPSTVTSLVLIDRGLKELPIHADIVGRQVPTIPGEEVRVRLREIDAQEGVWLVGSPAQTIT